MSAVTSYESALSAKVIRVKRTIQFFRIQNGTLLSVINNTRVVSSKHVWKCDETLSLSRV